MEDLTGFICRACVDCQHRKSALTSCCFYYFKAVERCSNRVVFVFSVSFNDLIDTLTVTNFILDRVHSSFDFLGVNLISISPEAFHNFSGQKIPILNSIHYDKI